MQLINCVQKPNRLRMRTINKLTIPSPNNHECKTMRKKASGLKPMLDKNVNLIETTTNQKHRRCETMEERSALVLHEITPCSLLCLSATQKSWLFSGINLWIFSLPAFCGHRNGRQKRQIETVYHTQRCATITRFFCLVVADRTWLYIPKTTDRGGFACVFLLPA